MIAFGIVPVSNKDQRAIFCRIINNCSLLLLVCVPVLAVLTLIALRFQIIHA
jgi:hypothetical protein